MPGVSLAGSPVLLDIDNKFQRIVDHHLRSFVWPSLPDDYASFISPFIPREVETTHIALPYGPVPNPRINEFINPTGATRYGRGMFLVGHDTMVDLAAAAFVSSDALNHSPGPPTTWGGYRDGVTLLMDYGDDSFSTTVYLFDPISVDSFYQTDLWIVPVADVRYGLMNTSVEIDADDKARTMQEMITILCADFPVMPAIGTVNNDLNICDWRVFHNSYISPTVALDMIALSVGKRWYLDNLTFTPQAATAAKARHIAILDDDGKTYGGKSPKVAIPDELVVCGPKTNNYVHCGSWTETVAVANGTANVRPFTVYCCCHLMQTVDGYGTINETARGKLIDEIGVNYSDWWTHGGMIVRAGCWDWSDNTCFDYVSIYVSGKDEVYTSAWSLPSDFAPRFNICGTSISYAHLQGKGVLILTPSGGIPARSGLTPGSAECDVYVRNPTTGDLEIAVFDGGVATGKVVVYNASKQDAGAISFFTASQVDCDLFISSGGGSGYATRIRFGTTAKMVDRQVAALIERIIGDPTNPAGGADMVVGDPVTISDPANLWSDIEANAQGWAYWDEYDEQWQVEECTLTINELAVTIETCMFATDAAKEGRLDIGGIRSTYPNVDGPDDTYDYMGSTYIQFDNPCGLDAVADSQVVIRRVTNRLERDLLTPSAPEARSSTSHQWEAVYTCSPIARWAKFAKGAGSTEFNLVSYWDGGDPSPCGPTLSCAFDCSCLEETDEIIGCWDPIAAVYRGISTESALLGPPDNLIVMSDLANGAACELEWNNNLLKVFRCGAEAVPASLVLATVEIPVVVGAGLSDDGLYFNKYTISVCYAEPASPSLIPLVDCEPDDPPPPPPCTCQYTWKESSPGMEDWDWYPTSECPEGCGSCLGPPYGTGTVNQVATFDCSGA